MAKWTDQQKLLNICGVMGAAIVLAIINEVVQLGTQNSLEILKLSSELGPDKAIRILKGAQKVVNIAA